MAAVYEGQLVVALQQQFTNQRAELLSNLRAAKTFTLKENASNSKRDKRDLLAALLLWQTYTTALKDVLTPILHALILETANDATIQVGRQPSQFDGTSSPVQTYCDERSDKIASDVNSETEKQLRASISEGIDNGESDNELQARIELIMGAALTYRADRIAQTETTRAQGFADVEAWKQAGNVTGKEWYTAADERVCIFCNSLDGTIVSLDSDYYSLGDTIDVDGKTLAINYDDVGAPPAHVNCRCTLEPVTVSLADL